MNESFINAEDLIKKITDAFYQQIDAVRKNTSEVTQLNNSYGKLPSDYLKTIKAITDAQIRSAKAEKELANATVASNRAKQSEITTLIKENALLRDNLKTQQQQQRQVQNTAGSYRQLSAELNSVRNDAKNLAADMYLLEQAGEQNTATYTQLESQFAETQQRVTQLDGSLKKIDASVGQHQRNVGNYSSAFNGLGNAINQLTREAPAFAVSINTGILALSNNIPMLFDELKRLTQQNKELIAQGQPVKSVFSQFVSSLFSWQTALSVGVTLLTLYGSKIKDWVSGTREAVRETDLLREATERYNDTIVETTTNSERELTALRRKIAVSQDVTKSEAERLAMAKSLIDQYPGYLKGLTEEELSLGSLTKVNSKYNEAIRNLTRDIQKRVDAESKQAASRETLKLVAEIEQEVAVRQRANEEARKAIENYGLESGAAKSEIKQIQERIQARKELTDEDQEFISKFGTIGIAESGSVSGLGLYLQSQITELQLRAQALRSEIEKQADETNKVFQEASLLDYKPDDSADKIQDVVAEDFLASQFKLNETRLQNEAAYHREIMENEENSYADREFSAKKYNEILIDLAELRLAETLRVAEKETTLEIAELRKRVKDKEITESSANKAILALQKQFEYDRLTAHETFSQEVIDANKGVEDSFKNVYKGISEQERQNKVTQQQIENLRQVGLLLDNVDKNTSLKQFTDLEKKIKSINEAEEQLQIQDLQAQRSLIDNEIERIQGLEKNEQNNEAINKLLGQQYNIDKQILGIENNRKQTNAELARQLKQTTEDYLNSFSMGFISDAGLSSLNQFFQVGADGLTDFERRFKGAGDDIGKQFAVTFNAISEVAQETFNFINQASQMGFDMERDRLEKRYQLALKYAGDSEEAQTEIQRQYEEKQRDLKRRELRAQKEQAIFNAIINTAQGVTAALAQANIPLSILIGILGAAQISFISSQQIPAYAEGGITEKNGAILVNDAKGSNYREVIQTPQGKTYKPSKRNTIMNVPKGTKIFKNHAEYQQRLSDMLNETGVAPYSSGFNRGIDFGMSTSNGLTQNDIFQGVKQALDSMTVVNNQFDATGYNSYVGTQNARTQHLNNVKSIKGITVK